MSVRDLLIGASLGNIVGSTIGLVLLPAGWLTVLLFVVLVVSGYIWLAAVRDNSNTQEAE